MINNQSQENKCAFSWRWQSQEIIELSLLLLLGQGLRSKFSSGGAREECVKEIFLLNYFLFNLFLFLRKSGGAKAPPQPLPLRGPCWISLAIQNKSQKF